MKARAPRTVNEHEKRSMITKLDELQKKMTDLCKPTRLQRLFNTEENKQKQQATALIDQQFAKIKELVGSSDEDLSDIVQLWRKQLNLSLTRVGSSLTPSELKTKLKAILESSKDLLEPPPHLLKSAPL